MLLLTEYCAGGTLNERLTRPSDVDQTNCYRAQVAFLPRGVLHFDLKTQNVLLTSMEDVKLADFGMAPEFIALKLNKARREDGSWLDCLIKYYTRLNVGPMYWVAPEFFCLEYTQNSEMFSLGAILFAILERDFIQIRNEKVYGVFKCIPTGGKVRPGYAMAMCDPEVSAKFSRQAQGSRALQRIDLDAL